MVDFELMKKLCLFRGPSGFEDEIREFIISEIKDFVDEYYVDNMGNLIVFKKGWERPKQKLMISAHMDEVGFIVNDITEGGLLKISAVGGFDARVLSGKAVTVGENAVHGVIGCKPIHLTEADERKNTPEIKDLHVDIGAASKEEALKAVAIGDMVCFDSEFHADEHRIMSKAIDDRVGCYILIELIKTELPYDMYFTFVVQEEIGLRGAKAAAFTVEPDAAIVVEATTACDIPNAGECDKVCKMGEGAVISFRDRRTVYDKEFVRLAMKCGELAGVKTQLKLAVAGGNDAGAIHCSRGGVRTAAISFACRYLHSSMSIISTADVECVFKTVFETAKRIAGGLDSID